MTRLQLNLLSNFAGQGWAALMSLAFVPLYIKFLGIEAYGLIGFYAMLQAAIQILDLGLTQTMNREMARYSALPEKSSEARHFVRTLEIGYWAIGIFVGAVVLVISPFIASHWIKSGHDNGVSDRTSMAAQLLRRGAFGPPKADTVQ
jgi:O-antigen/teichoic acid export membrane protein